MTPADKKEYLEDLFRAAATEDNEAQRVIQEMRFLAQALTKYETCHIPHSYEPDAVKSGLCSTIQKHQIHLIEKTPYVVPKTFSDIHSLKIATEENFKAHKSGQVPEGERLKTFFATGKIEMSVHPVSHVFSITLTKPVYSNEKVNVKYPELNDAMDLLSNYLETQGGIEANVDGSTRSMTFNFPISRAKDIMKKTTILYLRAMGHEKTPSIQPRSQKLKIVS